MIVRAHGGLGLATQLLLLVQHGPAQPRHHLRQDRERTDKPPRRRSTRQAHEYKILVSSRRYGCGKNALFPFVEGCAGCEGVLYMLALSALLLPAWTTMEAPAARDNFQAGYFAALVDVRRQDEWDAGHIENATFMPSLHETRDFAAISHCKQCRIAVYCRTGQRSKAAADILEAEGFESVTDVLGINQWTGDAGVQLVTGPSLTPTCSSTAAHCGVSGSSGSDGSDGSDDKNSTQYTIVAAAGGFFGGLGLLLVVASRVHDRERRAAAAKRAAQLEELRRPRVQA